MTLMYRHLVKEPGKDTKIAGRGIRVYTLLWAHRTGESPEAIAEGRDLPLGAVYEALAYAADHPDEMEEIQKADDAAGRQVLLENLSRLPPEFRDGIDIP